LMSIVPIFVFDMTTGGVKVHHFKFLKNKFEKIPVTIVLSKFKSAHSAAKLEIIE